MHTRHLELPDRGILMLAMAGMALAFVFDERAGLEKPGHCEDRAAQLQPIDRITEREVKLGLAHQAPLAGTHIDVEVADGAVRLTGDVHSQTERVAALLAATSVPGARVVIDDLRISAPE